MLDDAAPAGIVTLVDLLSERANREPDRTAYTFLDRDGSQTSLTYAGLDTRSRAVASALQQVGMRGERALLLFPQGLEFLTAFYGCLYAGVAAVPCYPPSMMGSPHGARLKQVTAIAADADISAVLCSADVRDLRAQVRGHDRLRTAVWLSPDAVPDEDANAFQVLPRKREDLAFIQYTSGSTATPKGVMGTHVNLLHNLKMLRALAPDTEVEVVSWLPLYHDMGLIGVVLGALFATAPCTLMRPLDFLQQPLRWLQTISGRENVISGGPNFAYDLCVQKTTPQEREALDLSGWIHAFNGAEPIRSHTLEAFVRAFKSSGFRPSAFLPGYGLAEATLMVTARRSAEPLVRTVDGVALESGRVVTATGGGRARSLVGCGVPWLDERVLIVDPETCMPCPPDRVGEIWVSGPHIATGYWNRKEETAATFDAHLANTGDGPFLRTGDAGFLREGELFVTGRLKDLIIIRGRNYYPQDIEATAEQAHPALMPSFAAAFSAELGRQERLVVVQAMSSMNLDVDAIAECIRRAVTREHEVEVYAVVLVTPGQVPKTTSGKIQRRACRDAYLNGSLDIIGESILDTPLPSPAATEMLPLAPGEQRAALETYVRASVGATLGQEPGTLDPHAPLPALGMDSLRTTELRNALEKSSGGTLPIENLTITEIIDLLQEKLADPNAIPPGQATLPMVVDDPVNRYKPFPLTSIQQAYLVGRSGAYQLGLISAHAYAEFESDSLDLPRLNRAWRRMIERHEMLRAVMRPDGQQQILERVPPYSIQETDLRDAAPEIVATRLLEIREQMSHEVLPADRWPLFNLQATHVGGGCVRLHCSFDLLITDVSSFGILLTDLAELYQDPNAELAPLTLSFRDYVLAEAKLRESTRYQQSMEYWLDRLRHLPPAPELPLAKAPRSLEHPRFVRRSGRVPADCWRRIKTRAAEFALKPASVLMAAFASVLGAWSKSQRFTINVTVANRLLLHEQIYKIVGDFTGVELLEGDVTGARDLVDLAERMQRQLWEDLEHRDVDGVQVLRELTRQRGGAATTMPVVFTSALGQGRGAPDDVPTRWLGSMIYGISQTPQVWMDHQVYEEAGALVFNWDCVEELFPPALLDAMFGAYGDLLDALATQEAVWQNPCLELLPVAQRTRRQRVNATRGPIPGQLLHTAFANQVLRRPEQTAVIAPDGSFTYADLAGRANQLTRVLRESGARPNALVGVMVGNRWEQVVAVLGVLGAGGAYLPISTGLPVQRRRWLLEHAQTELVITGSAQAGAWELPAGVREVSIEPHGWPGMDPGPLPPVQGVDDLAYVLYTSGSTGTPKGVAMTHRAAWNTIADINQRFGVCPTDRVFALSSLSFDLSVYDLFGLLGAGGAVVLPTLASSRDPGRWLALLAEHRVTIWNSVPQLAQMLVDHVATEPEGVAPALRLALLSGDWIPMSLPDRLRALAKDTRVISLGGATETAIWSIAYPIERVDPRWESIPYGTPLRNQWFEVFNERQEPCPVWVPGQLYIGGAGLAQGYWRDEVRTKASFIHHPSTGERLYRTGDLGRYLPDGNIEFLGREDSQVKIGGHRIELGEIEAVLARHPALRHGVVMAVGADRSSRRLVAYLVPRTSSRDDDALISEVRWRLAETLPHYMVPTTFLVLDTLPLTPNGKTDRNALAALSDLAKRSRAGYVAPSNEMETVIAEVVRRVLGIERVGVEDNLFELGADSLEIVRIHGELREALDQDLPLLSLFEFPSIRLLAKQVAGIADTQASVHQGYERARKQRHARLRRANPSGLKR